MRKVSVKFKKETRSVSLSKRKRILARYERRVVGVYKTKTIHNMPHHPVDEVDGGISIHMDFEEAVGKECLLISLLRWLIEKLC